ncbi:MAG: hypothetical protein J0M05_11400 [Candidatus Kapabacteria bacterium]|nr:hypothetical protein [Candidatus Kapabacteria bacterium]
MTEGTPINKSGKHYQCLPPNKKQTNDGLFFFSESENTQSLNTDNDTPKDLEKFWERWKTYTYRKPKPSVWSKLSYNEMVLHYLCQDGKGYLYQYKCPRLYPLRYTEARRISETILSERETTLYIVKLTKGALKSGKIDSKICGELMEAMRGVYADVQ